MNLATFLMVSLVVMAPATAFVLDHQFQYQQSLEDLSAEQNAIENTPKRHELKRGNEPAPRSEESGEFPSLTSSELFGRNPEESESEESDAIWHRTCGKRLPKKRGESNRRGSAKRLQRGVRRIWMQLNITMQQYRTMEYTQLYSGVYRGIEERQYVPTWIPDRGDAIALSEMNVESREHISLALSNFDTGLQRFAVAYEQMLADEEDIGRERALRSTQMSLRSLLCEIESTMSAQGWDIPPRVPRAIMSAEERRTPDFTRRMLRDWGVLLRYGTYLRAWSSMMNRLDSALATITS